MKSALSLLVTTLLIASALAVAVPEAAHASPPQLVQTNSIPSPGPGTDALAVNPGNGVIYAELQSLAAIIEINGYTGQTIRTIHTSFSVTGLNDMKVDTATNVVYVTGNDHTMEVFNGSSGAKIASVSLPTNGTAQDIAVDSSANRIYVLVAGTVVVVDGATDLVTASIPVAGATAGIDVDETTGHVYALSTVATAWPSTIPLVVSVIDPVSDSVTATYNVPYNATHIAVDSGAGDIYVGTTTQLEALDLSTGAMVWTAPLSTYGFVLDRASHTLYELQNGPAIDEIDGSTGAVVASISVTSRAAPAAVDEHTGNVYALGDPITVLSSPISITSAAPAASIMSSTTFSSTITAMATTAVTFSVTSGELPPGLTLDPSTGILSGIPYLGGKFTYSVTARDAIGGATTVSYTQSVTADVAVDRVAGADRFATGVAISQNAYPDGAKVVFIANGLNFPDALSAGPAAASLGGPVLLTAPASLPGVVANEIRRLGPSRIVVVGGTGVVSDAVFAKLKTMAATVERWAGASRYATSAAIVKNAFKSGASTIFLASGNGYPDALSAASVASALGIPVLLVNGSSAHVDAATLSTLRSLSTGTVYLAGGTASISNGVAQDLANAMGGNVYRFSGADRFRTSQVLNEAAYDTDGTNTSNPRSPTVFLVSGLGFPDGLSAGPWAGGIVDAPLYLVPGTCVPNQVLADIHGLGATEVVLIGGTGVLSEAVAALTPC